MYRTLHPLFGKKGKRDEEIHGIAVVGCHKDRTCAPLAQLRSPSMGLKPTTIEDH